VTESPAGSELTAAILALYQAPLDEFISRRDALAKQLRADKRRDDAALVKALKKPGRMAWVLDRIVGDDAESVERLAAAIAAAQTTTDLRSAIEVVKDAVRSVAAVGARVAVRAEHPIEPNAIASAIYAVIGEASAFAEFRAARLVEVPEGGGLDLLITMSPQPSATPIPKPPPEPPPPPIEPPKEDPRVALAAAARDDLRRAEQSLRGARERLEQATGAVRDTDAKLEAAKEAAARAQSELETRLREAERARRHAESATADHDKAQRAVDAARILVAEFE
jgi:hypothetical protein